MNADFVSEVPSLKLIAWKALISAGRRNDDIHDLLSKTAKESETEGHGLGSYMEDVKDMNIRDTFWHGRTIFHLTGSRAGFLVLPSFVAMVMASLIITASQVTVYACSRGQLSNLQLASSPSLEFHPWQTRYEVLVDTSFRQVTMVASSDPRTTQWILERNCFVGFGVFGDFKKKTQQKKNNEVTKWNIFSNLIVFFPKLRLFAQKGSTLKLWK